MRPAPQSHRIGPPPSIAAEFEPREGQGNKTAVRSVLGSASNRNVFGAQSNDMGARRRLVRSVGIQLVRAKARSGLKNRSRYNMLPQSHWSNWREFVSCGGRVTRQAPEEKFRLGTVLKRKSTQSPERAFAETPKMLAIVAAPLAAAASCVTMPS